MSPKSTPRSKTSIREPIFRIEIDGVGLEGKGFSAKAIGVDLVLNGYGTFTANLVGNNAIGAESSWMDDATLGIGKSVAIIIDNADGSNTMMDGKISSIRANFPSDGEPTLEIAGEGPKTARPSKNKPVKTVGMRWGKELLTFEPEIGLINDPVMNAAKRFPSPKRNGPETSMTTGIGECLGSPEIRPGYIVRLEGLGRAFSGDYQVIRTVHTVNGTDGYRTMIVVAKK